MKSIIINNNKYNLIRIVTKSNIRKIYWVWGKIDFISYFQKKSSNWKLDKVSIVIEDIIYYFVESSGHGEMFEETKWSNGSKDVYIELPPNFLKTMEEVSVKFNCK